MPSPPIQLFLTTIASQPALRQRQGKPLLNARYLCWIVRLELLLRTLHIKKIQFTSYDLASDEAAKRLWRRKAPLGEWSLYAYPPSLIFEISGKQWSTRYRSSIDNFDQTSSNSQEFSLGESFQGYVIIRSDIDGCEIDISCRHSPNSKTQSNTMSWIYSSDSKFTSH